MKFSKVRVQTYRSIVDSGNVDIEDGVTVVIGKNEQGKTNFLRAIRAFNSEEQFSPNDLPNHLRPSLEDRPAREIPIVSVWFRLESADKKRLADLVQGVEPGSELKCVKNYANEYGFWVVRGDDREEPLKFATPDISGPVGKIKQAVNGLKSKLQTHASRVPTFAANNDKIDQITTGLLDADLNDATQVDNVIKTFSTAIKGLTAQDQPILDDITATINELEFARASIQAVYQSDRAKAFRQLLPSFILHSTKADQIPNEVKVAEFVKDPEATSKGMSNLCHAAGLTLQKIRELAATSDTSQREAYEDHYKGTISGGLNEFWTQAEYHVHFRIEKEQLSVSISDGVYTQRVPPSDRSDGFQWYLSFYATLLNDVGVSNQTVLLLDNPGLELHVDGQRDIKRFLEERVTLNSQVIYVTHSPAMIDPFNLHQVRTVELLGNQTGTKISNFVVKEGDDWDLLEPVRSAIGMSLVASLVLNEWNVLVEGAADKPITEGIFFAHYKERRSKLLVNGSLSESKDAFLARFYDRTNLPYVVVLDADSGGRDLHAELTKHGIPESKIVKLEDVFPGKGRDFALEDILSAEFYHQAVLSAYPANVVEMPEASNRKRTTAYEEAFKTTHGIGFNKRRVAESAKKLLSEGREDPDTRSNLGTLSTAIISKLQAQVPEAPSVQGDVAQDSRRIAGGAKG
jgi:predicted ATP-dependent endonuclease of OLD family